MEPRLPVESRQIPRPSVLQFPPTELLTLWRGWKRTNDPRALDRLVFSLAGQVKFLVFRQIKSAPPWCDAEDFLSVGLEALIRSLHRYDPAMDCSLEAYTWTRIRGALLDELRRRDWAPRSVRRLQRQEREAAERLHEAIEDLPDQERAVAGLLYVTELNMRQAGEVLGLSESRISQSHSSMRRRLREALAADELLYVR